MKNQAVRVKHGAAREFSAKSTGIKEINAGIQHLVIKEQRLISNRTWSNERSRQGPENQLGQWRRQIDTMSQSRVVHTESHRSRGHSVNQHSTVLWVPNFCGGLSNEMGCLGHKQLYGSHSKNVWTSRGNGFYLQRQLWLAAAARKAILRRIWSYSPTKQEKWRLCKRVGTRGMVVTVPGICHPLPKLSWKLFFQKREAA